MRPDIKDPRPRSLASQGFTLVEMLITASVLGVLMIVLGIMINSATRSKISTSNLLESSQQTRVAVDLIARDLLNSGYGADRLYAGQPQGPIAYIDSMQVLINANLHGDATGAADTTAYNPAGSPNPFPLNGTSWQPPVKYRTRAEVIRWTLDTNNDGSVDAGDIADADGVDAQRTRNPNDYTLVREIYGDSTGGIAGNNGGTVERVTLLRRPTDAGVPPLFTVYLVGSANPWNWSNGPIPAAQIASIERIVIRAVGTSPRPDWRGSYARTEYQAQVDVTRNMPDFGTTEYAVDGYVYVDQNSNNQKDGGEPGVAGVGMALKSYSTTTSTSGYFRFAVPAGTYTLRHTPPSGYANATFPDSFVVTVGPAQTRDFKDTALSGGPVKVLSYDDKNGNGTKDTGEGPLPAQLVTLLPTSESHYTDRNGLAQFFAPTGAFTVTVSPATGYVATSTPSPYSSTMSNGGSDSVAFGLDSTVTGTIAGKVFTDTNRNGVYDIGEPGVQNVWVAASPDGGVTVAGYRYTDATGNYTLTVPANDPPGTQPYHVTFSVPQGLYPTGTTSLGPLLVQGGQAHTGKNFGVSSFQVITLDASRVLSLGSADLIEKDWSGNDSQWDTKGHQDLDLVMGADAGGTDNISVWFNEYDSSPLFKNSPSYTRNASNSVLALRLEMLDKNSPTTRFDAVTGTKYSAGVGNFFVWFAQNSGGNLGYFPTSHDRAYTTADLGDVQAVLTDNVGGPGTAVDIIVGTKSPTAGQGTIEVWLNDNATDPTFARNEIYPPNGSIPGNNLGEVTSMAMGDLDGDGDKDLVVGTKTGNYTGQLLLFERTGSTAGNRFIERKRFARNDEAITAVICIDANGDGYLDIVTGSQKNASDGRLEHWANLGNNWNFILVRQVDTYIVMSLVSADMGGLLRNDLVVGLRFSNTGYSGGVRIFYMDLGTIPPFGTDPSGGSITGMVPALTSRNLNYGVNPSTPSPPYLQDFAAGVKTGPTTGALVIFIR
jgi:prepilin-type N-terminal cleavage/methylation domain-containing protein